LTSTSSKEALAPAGERKRRRQRCARETERGRSNLFSLGDPKGRGDTFSTAFFAREGKEKEGGKRSCDSKTARFRPGLESLLERISVLRGGERKKGLSSLRRRRENEFLIKRRSPPKSSREGKPRRYDLIARGKREMLILQKKKRKKHTKRTKRKTKKIKKNPN